MKVCRIETVDYSLDKELIATRLVQLASWLPSYSKLDGPTLGNNSSDTKLRNVNEEKNNIPFIN